MEIENNKQELTSNKKVRRLIYTDASKNQEENSFTIGIYDPDKSATHTLNLKEITDNNDAERYAVFYAIFYIQKYQLECCHILTDNQACINNDIIIKL